MPKHSPVKRAGIESRRKHALFEVVELEEELDFEEDV
jgi:hypothetical protein